MAQETAVYTASELAAQAREIFGAAPEAVTAALKTAGIQSASVEDAKKIVKEFLGREVK